MARSIHHLGVGDTLTPLTRTLKQSGSVVNLTGKTVTFTMVNEDGTVIVNAASATVNTPATAGEVYYSFQAADVLLPGVFYGWFVVTSAGKTDTFPADGRELEIHIHARN